MPQQLNKIALISPNFILLLRIFLTNNITLLNKNNQIQRAKAHRMCAEENMKTPDAVVNPRKVWKKDSFKS